MHNLFNISFDDISFDDISFDDISFDIKRNIKKYQEISRNIKKYHQNKSSNATFNNSFLSTLIQL